MVDTADEAIAEAIAQESKLTTVDTERCKDLEPSTSEDTNNVLTSAESSSEALTPALAEKVPHITDTRIDQLELYHVYDKVDNCSLTVQLDDSSIRDTVEEIQVVPDEESGYHHPSTSDSVCYSKEASDDACTQDEISKMTTSEDIEDLDTNTEKAIKCDANSITSSDKSLSQQNVGLSEDEPTTFVDTSSGIPGPDPSVLAPGYMGMATSIETATAKNCEFESKSLDMELVSQIDDMSNASVQTEDREAIIMHFMI